MIILRVNDLSKHYGENVVLDRIGFTVEEGERMGLVGPNGAGKTTLLRILTGQLEADGGSFAFSGSPTIGYLEQTADLDSQSTVWDELIKVYAPVFAMEQRMRELEQLMSALGDESQPGFAQYAQEYSRLMESFEAGGGYGYRSAIAGVLAGLGLGPETHPEASAPGSPWPGFCLPALRFCCWTSPPTIWTWKRPLGWKIIFARFPARSSSFPTTGGSWTPCVPPSASFPLAGLLLIVGIIRNIWSSGRSGMPRR